jgi:hypothetical protein
LNDQLSLKDSQFLKEHRSMTCIRFSTLALLLTALASLSGCAKNQKEAEGPMEEAGEWTDEAAEDTGEAFEELGEETEEAADEASDDIEDVE